MSVAVASTHPAARIPTMIFCMRMAETPFDEVRPDYSEIAGAAQRPRSAIAAGEMSAHFAPCLVQLFGRLRHQRTVAAKPRFNRRVDNGGSIAENWLPRTVRRRKRYRKVSKCRSARLRGRSITSPFLT